MFLYIHLILLFLFKLFFRAEDETRESEGNMESGSTLMTVKKSEVSQNQNGVNTVSIMKNYCLTIPCAGKSYVFCFTWVCPITINLIRYI